MGTSRIRAMVPADLGRVPVECPSQPALADCLADAHAAWARAAQDQWGLCGVMVVEDEAVRSAVLVCPGLHLPPGHPLERWARVPGAAHLLALTVARPDDGERTTRLLVQGLARRLHGQAPSVEAVARPGVGDGLAPPVAWLDASGFAPCDHHPLDGCQRLRLDLGNGVRWREDLNRAWDLLAGLVPMPVRPETGAARRTKGRRPPAGG